MNTRESKMSDTPLPSALGINGNNSKCSDNTEEANDDANNISSSYVEAANDETANKENMPRRGEVVVRIMKVIWKSMQR